MNKLRDAGTEVTEQLKENRSSDSEIFVVLTSKNAPKNTMSCGQHIITLVNELQKSAGAMKQFGFPNIILTQSVDDVPQSMKRVEMMDTVFHEQLTVKLENIRNKFESPSVHNPFMLVDGKLVNMYGPKKQPFKLDPAVHEISHDKLDDAMREFVRENTEKKFSQFQTLVKGVIYSKYCCLCLSTILSNLKTLDHITHFVLNLSGGIRSPICTKQMELCCDWFDDQGKKYQKSCWRYSKVSSTSESGEDQGETSSQTVSEATHADVEQFTNKKMFNAYLNLDGCLKKHKSKLPVKQWSDHLFCVFCFKFPSTPWHECENLTEAEKKASKELCGLIEGKFAIDLELFETLKKFVESQLVRYNDSQKPAIVKRPKWITDDTSLELIETSYACLLKFLNGYDKLEDPVEKLKMIHDYKDLMENLSNKFDQFFHIACNMMLRFGVKSNKIDMDELSSDLICFANRMRQTARIFLAIDTDSTEENDIKTREVMRCIRQHTDLLKNVRDKRAWIKFP